MKATLAIVLSAVSASAAFAATWTNVESTQSNAKTATNWEGGSVPAFNNASAPVDVAFDGTPGFLQTVDWDANYNNYTWYLGSVAGDRRRIVFNRDNYRNLVLADSSGFTGYIRSWHALNALYHTGDAGTTATVGQFMFTGRQNLRSHNAGATLSIDRAFGSGVFEVNRKMYDWTDDVGTIDIGTIEGGNKSWLVVNGGTVVLHGAPYDATAIVGDPFLHLDALTGVETDEDGGRVFVTRWNDARGNGLYAEPGSATARPFVENGCVSFGSYVGEYAAYEDTANKKITQAAAIASIGPAGWLRLSSVRDDIREAFIVFRDNARLGHNAQFFGAPSGAKDVFARDCTRISNVDYIVPNLFMQNAGVAEIAAGDVRVDGVRIEGFARSETGNRMQTQNFSERLHVVSVGLDGTAAIDRIAAGEHGVGGLTIAEVVLYTNALSSVERRQVNAYLRAKWQTAEEAADRDLERLEFRKAISSLEVPSGTVRVGSLAVDSSAGSFTKTGEGTLAVENAAPDTAITVAGGAVSFVSGVADALPDASQPAAKPDVWFDASKPTYDTVQGTGDYDGTSWATNWRDVRDGTNACGFKVVAEVNRIGRDSNDTYGSWPVVAAGPFGRTVLDFGPGHEASAFAGYTAALADGPDERPSSAAFEIRKASTTTGTAKTSMQDAVQRTFFIAVNKRHIDAVVFGGEDFSPVYTEAGADRGKLDTGRAGPAAQGGVWTVNGEPFDPTSTVIPTNEWMVVGLETPVAVSMLKIAQGHFRGFVGGLEIGEILAYDRVLTAAERRQTETYLMRRWVDVAYEPPARETSGIASLTFSADADAVIDADVDMSIGRVEATGTLVKRGSGAVSVAIPLNVGVTSLAVESGTLSVSMTPDLFRTAALHLDAGKTDFFDYADAAEGEIAAWRDCDGRTAYYAKSQATAFGSGNTVNLANGVVTATADASSGLLSGKNYVSFGSLGKPGDMENGADAAGGGMRFVNSAGSEVEIADVREMHYVFRRTVAQGNNIVVGSSGSDYAASLVPSSYDDIVFWSDCTIGCNSPKKLDGDDWHADNQWFSVKGKRHSTEQFYVCSIAFTNAVKVNSIALDRYGSLGFGGIDLCELIIYTGATNTTLNADAIHSWLMAKWKGAEGGNVLPVTVDELHTADGATLNIDVGDNGVLQIGNFSLEVAFDAQGGWTQSAIAEDLHLPLTGNVRVTAAAGANIAPGDYTILTANSISGTANFWSIDSSGAPSSRRYSLFIDGNTLNLRVIPLGLSIIVK